MAADSITLLRLSRFIFIDDSFDESPRGRADEINWNFKFRISKFTTALALIIYFVAYWYMTATIALLEAP